MSPAPQHCGPTKLNPVEQVVQVYPSTQASQFEGQAEIKNNLQTLANSVWVGVELNGAARDTRDAVQIRGGRGAAVGRPQQVPRLAGGAHVVRIRCALSAACVTGRANEAVRKMP